MRGWPCKKRGVGHHFRAQEKGWANRKCALHWGWAMSKYALLIIQNHTWKMQTRELFHLIVCLFVCTDISTKWPIVKPNFLWWLRLSPGFVQAQKVLKKVKEKSENVYFFVDHMRHFTCVNLQTAAHMLPAGTVYFVSWFRPTRRVLSFKRKQRKQTKHSRKLIMLHC